MTYTKTPTDPDYAHGTETGKVNGCSCDPCQQAGWRAGKRRRVAKARGIALRADDATQQQVRDHLTMLREAHVGNTLQAIAAAADISSSTLSWFLNGKTKQMHRATFTKILALQPHHITQKDYYPREELHFLIGQLRALGYSTRWLSKQSGITRLDYAVDVTRHSGPVQASIYNAVRALYLQIGDRPATDEHMRKSARVAVMRQARREGFYPPAFYDEDGTLDWRAIPDHPWAIADEWCHTRIEDLRTVVENPELGSAGLATLVLGSGEQTTEHETLDKRFDRVLKRFDLRADAPGAAERRAQLEEALWRFYNRHDKTPVAFVLDHGLVDVRRAREIPKDHPDLIEHPLFVAWQEERVAGRRATRDRDNARLKQLRAAARAAREAERAQVAA